MDLFSNLTLGFERAFSFDALLFCFFGVTLGTFVGALPGLGALAAMALVLPLTFHLEPTIALIMLSGIFYGSQYGSSISAILLNTPGTPAAAVTCLDGYPLAMQGRAGPALFLSAVSSFLGGTFAILLLMSFAPLLASFARQFSSAEYFSVMVLGLIAASVMSQGSPVKGVLMVSVGVALGMVGTDVNSGYDRFTFGVPYLLDGLSLVSVTMGLFGVAEILNGIGKKHEYVVDPASIKLRSLLPTLSELRRCVMPTLRGSIAGSLVGILPGTGPTIASFVAYATEQKVTRTPDKFGHGAVEGIASPEAANNASVQAAFIPSLSLGIPGDAVQALLIGAMLIYGIVPGPNFITGQPEVFWGLVASFWIGNVLLLLLNIPLIGIWVRILTIPYRLLYPAILLFVCIGTYSVRYSLFDVYVVLVAGLVGYFLRAYRYPMAPLVLGFILSPLMEEHFRRTMLLERGDFVGFVNRPISATLLAVALGVLLLSIGSWARKRFFDRRTTTI